MLLLLVKPARACSGESLVATNELLNQHFVPCTDCTYSMALSQTPGIYQTASLALPAGDYDYDLRWLTAAEWALDMNVTFVIPCTWSGNLWAGASQCFGVGIGQPYDSSYQDCTFYDQEPSGTFNSPVVPISGEYPPFWVLITAQVHNQSLPTQLDFCLVASQPNDNTWYIVGFSVLGVVCFALVLVVIRLCRSRKETTPLLPHGPEAAKAIN